MAAQSHHSTRFSSLWVGCRPMRNSETTQVAIFVRGKSFVTASERPRRVRKAACPLSTASLPTIRLRKKQRELHTQPLYLSSKDEREVPRLRRRLSSGGVRVAAPRTGSANKLASPRTLMRSTVTAFAPDTASGTLVRTWAVSRVTGAAARASAITYHSESIFTGPLSRKAVVAPDGSERISNCCEVNVYYSRPEARNEKELCSSPSQGTILDERHIARKVPQSRLSDWRSYGWLPAGQVLRCAFA
jgi:hypothetical protein